MRRPETNEYSSYYQGYIDHVTWNNPLQNLEGQLQEIEDLFHSIPEEKGNYAYSEGKWSIKEVLGHMTDAERIMSYRALCISRKENQSLPGFEQDDYVKESNFRNRTLHDLLEDYINVRKSTLSLFKNLTGEMLDQRGVANNNEVTVLALLYIIAGHEVHHLKILKEKYI